MLNQASFRGDSTLDSEKKWFLVISTKERSNSSLLRDLVWSFSSKVPAAISEIDLKIWRVFGKHRQISVFPCATEEQENTASKSPGQQKSLLVYNSPKLYKGEAFDEEIAWGNTHTLKAALSGRVTQHRRVFPSPAARAVLLYRTLLT